MRDLPKFKMAASMDEDDPLGSEDFYAILNVSREASREEINQAYRKLSLIYHPDKHHQNVNNSRSAENLFNKIKKSHEVLSDPHRRALYDTLGMKGFEEVDGKEVVIRDRTPKEILEEYERLAEEREERRLQQKTNPKGSFSIGVDATDLFDRYELDDFRAGAGLPVVEISSMSLSQSIEAPLTKDDTAILSGSLGTSNGVGNGNVSASLRHIVSTNGWCEVELAAGNGAAFSLRGFRTLWKRAFGTMSGTLQFTPHGIRPGVSTMLATQLDKNLQGRMVWTAGAHSSLNTMVVWDTVNRHLVASLQLGIPNSFVMLNYTHKFPDEDAKVRGSIKAGTFGILGECGVEKKISQFSVLGASLVVGYPIGVTLKIKLNRGNQNYLFPVHLSDELQPSAIFYGAVLPVGTYFIVKKLLIQPFLQKQKEKEVEKKKESHKEKLEELRREAEQAQELMKETCKKSRNQEEKRLGLVIVRAWYGRIAEDNINQADDGKCIEVAVPLQVLVTKSKLIIHADTPKSGLQGFYDPCIGEEKVLYIRYKFHNKLHEVVVAEKDKVSIPKRDHEIKNPTQQELEEASTEPES